MTVVRSAVARGAATVGIGCAGGGAFYLLNLPLPWVLGSLFASALVSQLSGFRPGLPPAWRNWAMVAIGTMLGTGFTPDVIARAGSWVVSLAVMTLLSFAFCGLAYAVFRRWGDMNRETALFAAMPGGLSVVTMLAEHYKTEANRVVLCHTARLVVLLVSAPLLIQWISGIDLAEANRTAFSGSEALDLVEHGTLALVAVASWFIATRVRFPSVMLLLPLFASAAIHATDLVTVHVPPVLSALAQIVIGSGVGARFADYTLRQIARDGWLAAVVGLVFAAGSLAAALVVAPFAGADVAPLFLAYLPGGAPELGVVALALMIDPAMVAAHHVARVFLIVALLPWAAHRVAGKKNGAP
ncbi:AbrB family transcriptional regulator [Stappia stellulata]|uniref:AbrB family transcriptional regulator n=1 Tax=Stappia stellulata TaxID=71235 RepID=UPI001CD542AA|nr:AbrB family transcriptional regulator [Stappia stellulata]MCA1242091.1 AbrB family transcriptional regulator [Stappia stellulata]